MTLQEPTICTILTKKSLAHARTLARSFFDQHANGHMVALLVDEIDDYFDATAELFDVIPVERPNIPGFPTMTMCYSQRELCAAVKPYFLDYLLQERGCTSVCYFDPEITIHAPLDTPFALLETKLMVLIPHLLHPIPEDCFPPDEQQILQQGVYNLAFLGLAKHPECERFLTWWQQHVQRDCLLAPEQGLYLDQRWMDLVPTLFADVQFIVIRVAV